MENYPRFEKVNDNVIRIVSEKIDEVPLSKIIETRKQLQQKFEDLEQTLKNLDEIIDNADKLGIVVEEKPKPPQGIAIIEGMGKQPEKRNSEDKDIEK